LGNGAARKKRTCPPAGGRWWACRRSSLLVAFENQTQLVSAILPYGHLDIRPPKDPLRVSLFVVGRLAVCFVSCLLPQFFKPFRCSAVLPSAGPLTPEREFVNTRTGAKLASRFVVRSDSVAVGTAVISRPSPPRRLGRCRSRYTYAPQSMVSHVRRPSLHRAFRALCWGASRSPHLPNNWLCHRPGWRLPDPRGLRAF
jgi:hypothetical protein